VVPRCAELRADEGVGGSIARSERALCNTVDTVGTTGVELTNTVPVHAGAVVLQGVLDGDGKSVTPVGLDGRSRVLTVDQITWLVSVAIHVAGGVGNFEVVRDSLASGWVLLVEVGGNAVSIAPAGPGERTV